MSATPRRKLSLPTTFPCSMTISSSRDGQQKEIFLDEIKIDVSTSAPNKLAGSTRGTIIEIADLKGAWSNATIKRLCGDVSNLTDPVSRITRRKRSDQFQISIVCNGQVRSVETERIETLKSLIEAKPVLDIRGEFRSEQSVFTYETEGGREEVELKNSKITGLWVWRQRLEIE